MYSLGMERSQYRGDDMHNDGELGPRCSDSILWSFLPLLFALEYNATPSVVEALNKTELLANNGTASLM